MLKNKKILIAGLANKHSIAAGIAKAMHAQGAELAFTYQSERQRDSEGYEYGKVIESVTITSENGRRAPALVQAKKREKKRNT